MKEANLSDLDFVDVVDIHNVFVERRSLADCLRFGIHLAVTIFLKNSKGESFLQQRSLSDTWLPGFWTESCTEHINSEEDSASVAKREMNEELGIIREPVFMFQFLSPTVKSEEVLERETDIVYEVTSDEKVQLDT